jgi:hypothetical protein
MVVWILLYSCVCYVLLELQLRGLYKAHKVNCKAVLKAFIKAYTKDIRL